MPDPSASAARPELAWFDELYLAAEGEAGRIPWADRKPNRHLTAWLERERPITRGRRAAVVGCGLGDDAELLNRWGYDVVAFDLSLTAIDWCRRRFPSSRVRYEPADLLALPSDWPGTFDFVFEAYTLQALPNALRPAATRGVASLVKPAGRLLIICRGRDDTDPAPDHPPFPLTQAEVGSLAESGLRVDGFEDFIDEDGATPIRRFRASFVRD